MDRLWWNHIIKAHKFLGDIVRTVAVEGRSIILSLPDNVPWRNTLLELVEEQLKLENSNNAFEIVRCPEEEIGLFLLNKYCKKEIRATYRYGMTYAAFLGKCKDTVLNDRYIWVYDIPKNKHEEWLNFIMEYNNNVIEKMPAIFILETCDEKFANRAKKGIRKIIFDNSIGPYDKFAFCTLAATDNNCKEYLRPYLAELVSSICNEDIELCAECVNKGNLFLENAAGVINSIISTMCRSDGTPYRFSKSDDEIQKLIWETQLKSVFPVIEKYRNFMTKKYRNFIMKALPVTNSYGEIVNNPEDVEIGTLFYMAGKEIILLSDREYDELDKFREARNKLAHLNVIELSMVDMIMRRSLTL